jgi:Flp pilus assembly protein TadG
MTRLKILRKDQQGAAALEFALAVPVLIMMIWGIFQVGLLYQANAGIQHALGEGARYATLWPTPTNTQIRDRMSAKVFGTRSGTFGTPSVTTPATTVCTSCRLLSVTYSMPMHFLFMPGPTVTVTRSKQVYVAS